MHLSQTFQGKSKFSLVLIHFTLAITGYSNSAFGANSLGNNTIGAQNTAIGSSAEKVSSGSQNSTPNNSVFYRVRHNSKCKQRN